MSDVGMAADIARQQRTLSKAASRRKQSLVRTLAGIDARTAAGRRIAELRSLFAGDVELSPMRRLLIEQAATAIATAEVARGRYLAQGGDLSDLISAERRADAAMRRLGVLPPDQPAPKTNGGQAAPAPDLSGLSRLSTPELDRYIALLSEAKAGPQAATAAFPEAQQPPAGSYGAPRP